MRSARDPAAASGGGARRRRSLGAERPDPRRDRRRPASASPPSVPAAPRGSDGASRSLRRPALLRLADVVARAPGRSSEREQQPEDGNDLVVRSPSDRRRRRLLLRGIERAQRPRQAFAAKRPDGGAVVLIADLPRPVVELELPEGPRVRGRAPRSGASRTCCISHGVSEQAGVVLGALERRNGSATSTTAMTATRAPAMSAVMLLRERTGRRAALLLAGIRATAPPTSRRETRSRPARTRFTERLRDQGSGRRSSSPGFCCSERSRTAQILGAQPVVACGCRRRARGRS